MSDTLKRDCPHCGCPDQWVDLPCGMCNRHVEPERGVNIDQHGAAMVKEVIGWRAYNIERERNGVSTAELHAALALMPDQDEAAAHAGRMLVSGVPILYSPVYRMRWAPGVEWYFAECEGTGSPTFQDDPEFQHRNDHHNPARVIPARECNGGGHGCGFYAGRTHAHMLSLGYCASGNTVMARIQMQGKIIPATNGFRAQQVKILDLLVPFEEWELARDLKAVYGPYGVNVKCEQTRIHAKGTIPDWCDHCKAKMNPRSATCPLCGYVHK